MRRVDVMVVGTGTAGVAAATQAHQRGRTVAIAEEWLVGGLCNTRGCIPTKALLRSARAVRDVRSAPDVGVGADAAIALRPDFAAVMGRARDIAASRARGVEDWLPGIATLLRGPAEIVRPGVVRVGDEEIGWSALVVATGSEPFAPPVEGLSDVAYHTSDTIWGIDELPGSIAMIGAGPISVELGCFFNEMGADVTIVQRSGRLLTREDQEVCAGLAHSLARDGIVVHYDSETERVAATDKGVSLALRGADGGERMIDAELLLVATGRRPKVDGLGLERLGVAVGPAGITVDERCRTTAEDVYAAGDVVGHYQLTDVAYHEGVVAGVNAAGASATTAAAAATAAAEAVLDERVVPHAVFSFPELGGVGLTEEEARERFGEEVTVGRTPMSRVGKAQADSATDGMAKLIAGPDGTLLGAHFLGGPAGELAQVAAMAMLGGVDLDGLAGYIPIHPTYAEAINIAALAARREKG